MVGGNYLDKIIPDILSRIETKIKLNQLVSVNAQTMRVKHTSQCKQKSSALNCG